jgi:hypothetical protein
MPAYPAKTSTKGWALIRVVARSIAGRAGLVLGLVTLAVATVHAAPPFSTLRLSEYQKQNWQVEDGLPKTTFV